MESTRRLTNIVSKYEATNWNSPPCWNCDREEHDELIEALICVIMQGES
jgi:hypothetical protein